MITFPRERIVKEWFKVTPEEFIKYLMEVRCYEGKYHFYVNDGINKGMLSWACEYPWKETNYDLCDFDPYSPTLSLQKEIRVDIIQFLDSFEE